jgi:PhzF family phenazine biosynthesis protein
MIKDKIIYQVDAFTDEPFKGNPAGVMIVDKFFDKELMQNIASEMNLSETAFLCQNENYFDIRYFTPTREVPLCGHATLASAHIIFELGLVKPDKTISIKATAADLTISKDAGWLVMNFPVDKSNKIDIPKGFKEIIGFEPIETWSTDFGWIIAIAKCEEDILNANPNFEKMVQNGLGHLMITSQSERNEVDFVLRCFAPVSGINEDPVTGSAHCALTPLWAAKLGLKEMNSFQLSKRTGKLKVKLVDDRVEIKGKAVTVFEARFKI